MKPAVILFLLSASLAPGCGWQSVSVSSRQAGSRGSTVNRSSIDVGKYRITTVVDVPMSQSMQDQRAVLTVGEHTLIVDFDKQRLTWDNQKPVNLPAGTREIEVEFIGGKLDLKADGAPVTPPGDST